MSEPLIGQSDDPNQAGVLGEGGTGVYGRNITPQGNGVIGYSDDGRGVWGHSKTGFGLLGESVNGRGVVARSDANYGLRASSVKSAGIRGSSNEGRGVEGWATNSEGVVGISANGNGVWGQTEGAGIGVLGSSKSGVGVYGKSETAYGVYAYSKKSAGIRGDSDEGRGVEGWATSSEGVVGISANGNGVWGQTEGAGIGVLGSSKSGVGVYGKGGRLAGFFEGDVEVTGDIRLTNADCAEDFDIAGLAKVEPGTVMVIDSEGALRESDHAYDKRVAGVISGAGNFKPGIVLDKQESSNNRMPIALLGKVYCKVDAQYGAIEVGDLLTTSSTPGHAMKVMDAMQAFGSVIGKALHPLQEGQQLIPILIALQ